MLSGIWIFHRFRLINENLSRSMSRDVRASVAREFESATRDIPGVTLRPAEEANTAQWVSCDGDDCGDFYFYLCLLSDHSMWSPKRSEDKCFWLTDLPTKANVIRIEISRRPKMIRYDRPCDQCDQSASSQLWSMLAMAICFLIIFVTSVIISGLQSDQFDHHSVEDPNRAKPVICSPPSQLRSQPFQLD